MICYTVSTDASFVGLVVVVVSAGVSTKSLLFGSISLEYSSRAKGNGRLARGGNTLGPIE
jgi:hypothetical protein